MTPPSTSRGQRGAAALTSVLCTMALMALVVPLLLAVTGVLAAGSQARTAADAAAVAVLSGSVLAGGDGDPDTATGDRVARANGAALVAVDLAGWPTAVVVEVRVTAAGWLQDRVTARAAARLEPP
ncbi:hypothetical protein BH23ACT9_BH23ACT9_03440 [soil metagenome]